MKMSNNPAKYEVIIKHILDTDKCTAPEELTTIAAIADQFRFVFEKNSLRVIT